jgi:proline iminopeptidase
MQISTIIKSRVAYLTAIIFTLLISAGCTKQKLITEAGNLVPKTVDQDATIPSISVNGTQLHAETFGDPDSAMIVVLHGGPGADYRSLLACKEFANQGYYVVFYDQRGSGLSKRHPKNSYSLQIMYDDLSGVISHYRTSGNQKIFLLGHSWGGILATAYINKYPAAVNGVILAEPGGFTWSDISNYIKRKNDLSITSETFNDVSWTDQFITGNENQHEILDYKYLLASASDGAKDNPIGNEGIPPAWRYGAVVFNALFSIAEKEGFDATTNLDQYSTKVLFAYSERNRAYGSTYAQQVSAAYPNVQLFKVNGGGHDMLAFPIGWNNFYPVALAYLNSLK